MNRWERGFGLIEVLAGLAVGLLAMLALSGALTSILHWNVRVAKGQQAEATLSDLVDRLENEANASWAIFTPPADVFGSSNSDGHEVDFFSRDTQQRPSFSAYDFDPGAKLLHHYTYASPGIAPIEDGPAVPLESFDAQTSPVTALQDDSTPFYSPLYANATLKPAVVHFGYADAPWIAGGNQLTLVRLKTKAGSRNIVLSTQTAPSGYIVALTYTPAPAVTDAPPPLSLKTALVQVWRVSGFYRECNLREACNNADWPQYVWTLTVATRSYQSTDNGSTWMQTENSTERDGGISTPSGGDTPHLQCPQQNIADYVYACGAGWQPQPPPATQGMDFSPPL